MPTPEREVRYPSPSGVPMKDLLASCAAASAVSTPPAPPAPDATPEDTGTVTDAATGDGPDTAATVHGIRPPAQREAA
ncbi:hypothetical protein [Streptomyces sp. NBC_00102]|uniref:hypothetical protein n=1 Tax=Streptomyces sp. NBC_00102 TaxID=2975652 RepID=UPI00224E63A9|nr:hypothetical protein [Streptomyces sp. NBC_00102]MCX5397467.1 hypothetical protein [Streptomyces sp. NBC_00102]